MARWVKIDDGPPWFVKLALAGVLLSASVAGAGFVIVAVIAVVIAPFVLPVFDRIAWAAAASIGKVLLWLLSMVLIGLLATLKGLVWLVTPRPKMNNDRTPVRPAPSVGGRRTPAGTPRRQRRHQS